MCVVKKGPNHGPAPIPEEGKWVKAKEIKDISGLTHGIDVYKRQGMNGMDFIGFYFILQRNVKCFNAFVAFQYKFE